VERPILKHIVSDASDSGSSHALCAAAADGQLPSRSEATKPEIFLLARQVRSKPADGLNSKREGVGVQGDADQRAIGLGACNRAESRGVNGDDWRRRLKYDRVAKPGTLLACRDSTGPSRPRRRSPTLLKPAVQSWVPPF
jgi:hypothetical protein